MTDLDGLDRCGAPWPEFMSVATAARYADLSPSMVRKLLADPADPLPSLLLGRARRIPRAALDAYLARRLGAAASVDVVLAEIRSGRPR